MRRNKKSNNNHMKLENINRIELQGQVGSVKFSKMGESEYIRFTLATSEILKGQADYVVAECTWHNAIYFKRPDDTLDLSQIKRGTGIHLTGRLRNQKVLDSQGNERTAYEIIVSELSIITD